MNASIISGVLRKRETLRVIYVVAGRKLSKAGSVSFVYLCILIAVSGTLAESIGSSRKKERREGRKEGWRWKKKSRDGRRKRGREEGRQEDKKAGRKKGSKDGRKGGGSKLGGIGASQERKGKKQNSVTLENKPCLTSQFCLHPSLCALVYGSCKGSKVPHYQTAFSVGRILQLDKFVPLRRLSGHLDYVHTGLAHIDVITELVKTVPACWVHRTRDKLAVT